MAATAWTMSWCPEEVSHENDDRLELDIQDEEYCNPIYSPTFTRHEMDYDEQYSSEQYSQEHNAEDRNSVEGEEDVSQAGGDGMTYSKNNADTVLSFFSCFSPAARPRTDSMASATSDSSADLSFTSAEDESQSAVEFTVDNNPVDIETETSSATEHKCGGESKGKKAPKATKGRSGVTAATKRKQAAAAAAKRKQAARAKKRKVVESSPEPVIRMHTSRSGRRVRHKAY